MPKGRVNTILELLNTYFKIIQFLFYFHSSPNFFMGTLISILSSKCFNIDEIGITLESGIESGNHFGIFKD